MSKRLKQPVAFGAPASIAASEHCLPGFVFIPSSHHSRSDCQSHRLSLVAFGRLCFGPGPTGTTGVVSSFIPIWAAECRLQVESRRAAECFGQKFVAPDLHRPWESRGLSHSPANHVLRGLALDPLGAMGDFLRPFTALKAVRRDPISRQVTFCVRVRRLPGPGFSGTFASGNSAHIHALLSVLALRFGPPFGVLSSFRLSSSSGFFPPRWIGPFSGTTFRGTITFPCGSCFPGKNFLLF